MQREDNVDAAPRITKEDNSKGEEKVTQPQTKLVCALLFFQRGTWT